MRKTDDNKIFEMLREGKSQKEIAEHFEVSPASSIAMVRKALEGSYNLTILICYLIGCKVYYLTVIRLKK